MSLIDKELLIRISWEELSLCGWMSEDKVTITSLYSLVREISAENYILDSILTLFFLNLDNFVRQDSIEFFIVISLIRV